MMDIYNFKCYVCKKIKSIGTPREEDGRYICAECRRIARIKFIDRRFK